MGHTVKKFMHSLKFIRSQYMHMHANVHTHPHIHTHTHLHKLTGLPGHPQGSQMRCSVRPMEGGQGRRHTSCTRQIVIAAHL
jgi:hypothetical protein